MNPLEAGLRGLARALARWGVIDAERGERTVDLAWPRMVTGVARMSQRVVDFAMIGWVLGPSALAGMAFALAYWQVGNTLSLGLSGGTISLVSQGFGADDREGIDRAVAASVVVSAAVALPLAALFAGVPRGLVGLLGGDPASVGYGATYLRIAALGLPFAFLNKIGSRTLVGAGDARSPMSLRAGGAVLNVVLNAAFIFGLGMGVAGAALGTLVATAAVTVGFVAGFLRGGLPGVGPFPVRTTPSGARFDPGTARRLLGVALPLMGRRLAQTLAVFPLLAIAATFGSVVVAGMEVARRIRMLMGTPNWGFSLAASSLVGQRLGDGDEAGAAAYGWDVLWFATVVHVATALAVVGLAEPISAVFVDEPGALDATVPFVRAAALSAVGMGLDGVATGVLRGGGDTRWPMYGKLIGLYLVALPVAYAGVVTPLGVLALYLALLAEMSVPAAVSLYRFRSGRWLAVSRGLRAAPAD